MSESPLLYIIAFPAVLFILYRQYLDFSRDVPPEYLELQLDVDSTRLPNELAIYKSTKLDYSSGLRVGLGIRYDHYKLRNGNLSDIWEIFLQGLKRFPDREITVGNTSIKVSELNHQVHELLSIIEGETEIWLPISEFITTTSVLTIVVACFVSRVTLHLYDEKVVEAKGLQVKKINGDLAILIQDRKILLSEISKGTKLDFENVYTPDKDRGIALRLTTEISNRISASTDFTQTNLVSAAASTIKSLPPQMELSENDKMVILQDNSSAENITNSIVKLLACFVTHCEIAVTQSENFQHLNPTVLCAPVSFVKNFDIAPKGLDKYLYHHRLFALSRLKFSNLFLERPAKDLRLIFAHRSFKSGTYTNWNPLRAALGTQIVEELGYFNVAGPLIVSDVQDYRNLPSVVTDKISGFGCLVQANEFKLVNYDGIQPGDLCARGYNIGKATTTMQNVGEKQIRPDKEGFYTFPFEARWGTDGCIYLMNLK